MKVITARAKRGKTKYLYDEIKKELKKDSEENLILLVPDLMTYETEYDIIERLKLEGIMKLEVLSFKRLVHRVMDELGGVDHLSDIDGLGKTILLRSVFEENRGDLKLFKKASLHPGFLKQFNFLLQELKQNLISVENLEKTIGETDNIFLKNKLSDIALIYAKYNEASRDRFLDEEDIYDLVIPMIGDSSYIGNSRIWIDGFESFNRQRLNMIKALDENSKSLTLSLNIDEKYLEDLEAFDDWEAFKITWDTFKSLEALDVKHMEIINLAENPISNKEIGVIEKNLFAIDLEIYGDTIENVEIYSAMDPYEELELTSQRIIGLVRDQGYRWKDIKIAVGDLDTYILDIKKVFLKFQIPYFADIKRDITNNPLSKYILAILDMFLWNFKYDDVFQYLKTGLSSLGNDQINRLENFALENGIEGSKWFENIEDKELEDIRKIFISDFKNKIGEFKSLTSISDISSFLFSYFKLHGIHKKIGLQIDSFRTEGKYEEESEYLQVWNSIMDIFEQILSIGACKEISPLEYRKILESSLRDVKISIIPPTIDRVEIGDIERIASSSSKILFILGANEGSLDSNQSKGILLDEELQLLEGMDISIISTSDFSYFKKKHMLYKLFTNPSHRLYISYAMGTSDGKSLQASLFIDILKMIFPKIKENTRIEDIDSYDKIANNGGTYDLLLENMNGYIKEDKIDDIWKAVYLWYRENDYEKYDLMNRAFNYENKTPQVEDIYMGKIFDEEISTTVSKLENYAECQFKYFVKNILKAQERKIQGVEFYDLGNIYHGALESFIDKIIKSQIKIQDLKKEDVNTFLDQAIEDGFKEYRRKVTALDANKRNKYLEKKTERVIRRAASVLIKQLQRGEFSPKYTELKIGNLEDKYDNKGRDEYIDSLEIEAGGKKVKLRGVIDRVDLFQDLDGDLYINIIDYKSSSKDIDFTDTYEGIQVQLLVYLKAVLEGGEGLFGKKPKLGGVYYYHIDDPIIKDMDEGIDDEILKTLKLKGLLIDNKDMARKMDREIGQYSSIIPAGFKKDGDFTKNSNVLSQSEFNDLLEYVHNKIGELSHSILDGNFNINPYRKKDGTSPCSYCEYLSICQFDELLGDEYRRINPIKRDDFLARVSQGEVDQ